ncbi:MAG: cupin 2, conserved barrel, partial [Phycisphaerales bacterium]|nr:cupin 2, conserved barrel [Phycisphaerales bacterium]
HYTPLLGRDQTGGRFGISINRSQPGDGPPPHLHRNDDEGFYILEGEMTFLYGDRLLIAGPGTFVWGPRNVVHSFKCTSATPAETVLIVTPTAFFDFAATLSKPADRFEDVPEIGQEDIAKLLAVAPEYGIEMRFDYPMPAVIGNAAGASKQLWVMGEHVSYLATSEQTAGQFTVVEIRTAPGGGPPPHVHTVQDEVFYIVEGRHEVLLDGRTDIAGPGDLVFIPHGTRHRYSNIGDQPGKMLSIHTPGGFQKFFDECGVDAANHPTAPQMPPPPPEAIEALLARHGTTM